jgi:hypothetical protein
MKSNEKMRMCPYCEGTVPLESASCRFCGQAFQECSKKVKGAFRDEADPFQYHPPYSPATEPMQESVFYPENKESVKRSFAGEEVDQEEENGYIVALTLLSCGGMLLTLSLLLLFFSEHGRLVLEWKSRYWSLYMILGTPMLYYGINKIRQL